MPGSAARLAALVALAACGLAGCAEPPLPGAAEVVFAVPDSGPFEGAGSGGRARPYNVLAADMERDGDPDLLINWHILGPLELFENLGGRFRLVNPQGSEVAGLYENRGVPWLYSSRKWMLPRILDRQQPGVYVWHDPNRERLWNLLVLPAPGDGGPLTLAVRANRPLEGYEGLQAEELEIVDAFELRMRLGHTAPYRHLRVGFASVGTQLRLTLSDEPAAAGLGFFAGRDMVPLAGRSIELWKPDPHGIAWAQVAGSPLPDLFVTRGGLQGRLQPPHDPKTDRLFIAEPGQPVFYRLAEPGTIPPGYGRGRQVEWVDVDNDGRCELYIGNHSTPNTLLAWDAAEGGYRDRAPALGLDFEGGRGFAWLDLDDDGYQDLLLLLAGEIELLRNRGGTAFERASGSSLGLAPAPAAGGEPFAATSLQVADFNNDGRLDLLANGAGTGVRLLLREERFVDATVTLGLAAAPASIFLVPFDADNDGWLDFLAVGEKAVLFHNRGSAGFAPVAVAPDLADLVLAAAALDADGDGLEDLVLVSNRPYLLRNATVAAGRRLRVAFAGDGGEPIGAVVRAIYDDGTSRAQRYGSAHNAADAQALRPLDFGAGHGRRIAAVEVSWPGGGPPARRRLRRGQESLVLERPTSPSRR